MKMQFDGRNVWVNYHHLFCFYMVATEGGLTAASKKLGIGQSALSIQLKQFEEQLGKKLFERENRRLTLTETGKVALSYAKEIFRLGGEMIESLNDRASLNRTHLQIGALDTIPKHLTVKIAESALEDGKTTITIVEGKTGELLRDLLEHRVDLLVCNQVPSTSPGQIFSRRIARLPLWIVGGKSFLKLKKGFPASLEKQPFIVPTGDSSVRHELESFCRRNGLQPDFIAETQDVMVQKLLALRELGLTVVPEFAIGEYLERNELYKIGDLGNACEELFLISAHRKISNPAAAKLMEHFRIR